MPLWLGSGFPVAEQWILGLELRFHSKLVSRPKIWGARSDRGERRMEQTVRKDELDSDREKWCGSTENYERGVRARKQIHWCRSTACGFSQTNKSVIVHMLLNTSFLKSLRHKISPIYKTQDSFSGAGTRTFYQTNWIWNVVMMKKVVLFDEEEDGNGNVLCSDKEEKSVGYSTYQIGSREKEGFIFLGQYLPDLSQFGPLHPLGHWHPLNRLQTPPFWHLQLSLQSGPYMSLWQAAQRESRKSCTAYDHT